MNKEFKRVKIKKENRNNRSEKLKTNRKPNNLNVRWRILNIQYKIVCLVESKLSTIVTELHIHSAREVKDFMSIHISIYCNDY